MNTVKILLNQFVKVFSCVVEQAEQARLRATLLPFVRRNIPVLGLEPSCLFTLRDELPALLPGEQSRALAEQALLIEEFLIREIEAGQFDPELRPRPGKALLHGHCHQKAFGTMGAVERCLGLVPGLQVETIASSCCGMAGAFGYQRETADISLQMGELNLLPKVRAAAPETLIIADGLGESSSFKPARMVVCDSPVASATRVIPPRPIARASTAAQRRRVRSSCL